MFRYKLLFTSLALASLLFVGIYQAKSQKEIIMGGTDYSFVFEDRIILGEDNDSPTSTRLFVEGGAEFTNSIKIGNAGADNEAVTKSYVDPYLNFWDVKGDGHVHNANFGRIGINMDPNLTPDAQLQINASTSTEALRIISASDYSPFNIRNTANTADIWRIDQTGSLATGTIPWERISGTPTNIGSNWSESGDDIYRLTGKVGIGTDDPETKLQIGDGTSAEKLFLFGPNLNATSTEIVFSDKPDDIEGFPYEGMSIIYDSDNNGLRFRDNKNKIDRLLLERDTGRVGIGTTSPLAKISIGNESGEAINVGGGHIAGLDSTPLAGDYAVPKSYVDSNFISSSTLPTINNAFLQGGNAFGAPANLGTTDNQRLAFLTNNTEKMTILGNGNVGIGTTAPGAPLEVKSSTVGAGSLKFSSWVQGGSITVGSGSSNGNLYLVPYSSSVNIYDGSNAKKLNVYNAGISAISLDSNGNSYLNGGNVGIGTTNPTTAKLVVDNGTGVAIDVAGGRIIGLDDPNDPGDAVSKDYVDSNFLLSDTFLDVSYWQFNSNNLFASSSDWKIGIGTSTPSAQLQINANTGIEGLRIITSDYSPLVIRDNTDANDLFRVNQEGKLKSASSITPGDDDTECTIDNTGAIKHNPDNNQTYICDGTRWLNQRNCGTVSDANGNTYGTVVIGGQCWMDENINVGTRIDGGDDQGTSCANIEKYCYSDQEANCDIYGGLYQWDQAMCGSQVPGAQGICPTGWHVPTDAEWNILEKTVMQMMGGSGTCSLTYSGYQCKPAGTALKANLTGYGGTDKVGFKGILSGLCNTYGGFYSLSSYGHFWSSTPSGSNAWRRYLDSNYSYVHRVAIDKGLGFSLRCLKD